MNTLLSSEHFDLNETISDDDDDASDERVARDDVSLEHSYEQNQVYNGGRWTKEEQFRFMEGIVKYKNDWKRIQMNTRTRSSTQVRSHAQKFFLMCKKALSLRKGTLVEYDTKKTINNIFDSVFKRNDCTPNDDFYICIEQMIFNTDKHRTNTRGSVRCKRKSSDTQVIEDDDISQGKVQMIFNITKSSKCSTTREVNGNGHTAKPTLSERNPFNITFDINGNELTNISSEQSCSNVNINRDDEYVFETYAYEFDMSSSEKEIENESVEYLYKCEVNSF